mmetsp:Transcript_14113/g.25188  ORF Transcript_14113/g.25188 Transcript_14113/m.25188 type:complete len:89 (-) Transcript_14113:1133-1399(-)
MVYSHSQGEMGESSLWDGIHSPFYKLPILRLVEIVGSFITPPTPPFNLLLILISLIRTSPTLLCTPPIHAPTQVYTHACARVLAPQDP